MMSISHSSRCYYLGVLISLIIINSPSSKSFPLSSKKITVSERVIFSNEEKNILSASLPFSSSSSSSYIHSDSSSSLHMAASGVTPPEGGNSKGNKKSRGSGKGGDVSPPSTTGGSSDTFIQDPLPSSLSVASVTDVDLSLELEAASSLPIDLSKVVEGEKKPKNGKAKEIELVIQEEEEIAGNDFVEEYEDYESSYENLFDLKRPIESSVASDIGLLDEWSIGTSGSSNSSPSDSDSDTTSLLAPPTKLKSAALAMMTKQTAATAAAREREMQKKAFWNEFLEQELGDLDAELEEKDKWMYELRDVVEKKKGYAIWTKRTDAEIQRELRK